jgi:hypothetical protein
VDFYNYNLDLPFTNKKVYFRELNTKEQLLITKANISFLRNSEDSLEYHFYILNIILNCVKNKEDFLKINIIEYILFLLKLKIISVGSEIEFLLNNAKNKTKIKIDLKKYMYNLYEISKIINDSEYFITENDIEIKIVWPFLKDVLYIKTKSENQIEEYKSFQDTLVHFIEYIKIKNKKIDFFNFTQEQKDVFFEKIPAIIKNKIEKNVFNLINKIINKNLFDLDFLADYKFTLYNFNFVEHIKIIFSYDLKSLYKEIYYLAVNNLPPEYVLSISDFERKTFLTIIQEENKKAEQNSENSSEYSDAVKKLQVEFGQNLNK